MATTTTMRELGSFAIEHSGGRINEEWHRDLQGSEAMRTFREMIDNSGVLGGWYTLFEFLIRQANLRVDAGRESDSARAERDRIMESLNDMETSPSEIVGEIASAGVFGFALWELVYKIRRGPDEVDADGNPIPELFSKYTDGRIGWYDFAFRPQDSLSHWEFDKRSRWTHFVQASPPDYAEIPIPRRKLIHFTPRSWKRSPEGRSMIRSAVIAYRMSKGHSEREAIAGFKNASGQLYMEMPMESFSTADTPDAREARAIRQEILKDLGKFTMTEYSAMGVPTQEKPDKTKTGWKLGQLEGAKAIFPYDVVIRRWDSRQLIVVLAEHIIQGLDKHGSNALKDVSTNLFALALGAILKRACEVLTAAAAELSRLNGIPAEDYVTIAHDDIETPELTHIANFIGQILGIDPSRLNDQLRRYLEQYAQIPAGSLGLQEEHVDAKPDPVPAPAPADEEEEEDEAEIAAVPDGEQLGAQILVMEKVKAGKLSVDQARAFLEGNFGLRPEVVARMVPHAA